MPSLGGKIVILTGAAAGLGRAMTLALLEQGASVVAADVSGDGLRALADSAAGLAGSLRMVTIDLAADGAEEIVVGAALRLGPIHGLVNNAGIGGSGLWRAMGRDTPRFWEIEVDLWRKVVEVNLGAVFRLSRAVVPHMLAAGSGRIINVTTSMNTMMRAGSAPYGPSKAGAEALTSIMAEELAGTGITVNVLIPGGSVDTRMVADRPGVPRSALLRSEIMAPPLLWLLSEQAAGISGRRFAAFLWDSAAPPEQAAEKAGAPIAWKALATAQRREVPA